MRKIASLLFAVLIGMATLTGCNDRSDDRIPPMPVRIEFQTVGDWTTYGVAGATDYVYFTQSPRQPAGYPYTALSATGFGGVVLVGDILGTPRAYDMSCPVEARRDILIYIDDTRSKAVCPKCGSTYEIFELGTALSGEAAKEGYSLRRYTVRIPGPSGAYAAITN